VEKESFVLIRKKMNRTQKQLAELLGVSLKAIHSYEQGWRKIPLHIERQLWFLIYQKKKQDGISSEPCWERKSCEMKDECSAYEFQCGDMCWFVCVPSVTAHVILMFVKRCRFAESVRF
jgi:predicted transcriptional regulator